MTSASNGSVHATGGADANGGTLLLPRRFHAKVDIRWSDMDVFQHVNHARMVTLLEEALGIGGERHRGDGVEQGLWGHGAAGAG